MDTLTESQKQALNIERNISVTAGAGSGKTRILVERYLKIVLSNPRNVRRVLAITFTKKAAGEMHERIADVVNARIAETSDPKRRARLLHVRDQLNSASISTIHGFCARVLREFPIEAGITPDFIELDEMKAGVLIQQAIQQTFDILNAIDEPDAQKHWMKVFGTLPRRTIFAMLDKALEKPFEMDKIAESFSTYSEADYIKFLETQWLQLIRQILGDHHPADFLPLVEEILNLDDQPAGNDKKTAVLSVLTAFRETCTYDPDSPDAYQALQKLADRMTTNDHQPYKNLGKIGSKAGWISAAGEALLDLSGKCAEAARLLSERKPGDPPGDTDRQWFFAFKTFLKLYAQASDTYLKLKTTTGLVDFEDLQLLTLRLLQRNEAVRNELADRYDYIMVDEFQDTNLLQWQIVDMLSKKPDRNGQNDVFIVGDPKQSIYGFRDADIRIFKQVKQLFATADGRQKEDDYAGNIYFSDSFRFLPLVNAFINYIFNKILREDPHNAFEVGYHPLDTKRDLPGKGRIELAILDKTEQPDIEAEYIASRIANLMRDETIIYHWRDGEQDTALNYGDVAILLRSRQNLLPVEQALRRRNIPFKTAGGIGFWQKQEIYDIYHLLRFISNPSDDYALIAVLRSKLFMIPDSALFMLAGEAGGSYLQKIRGPLQNNYRSGEKELLRHAGALLDRWLQCRDRLHTTDLLNRIIDDLKLYAVYAAELDGEQLVANLEKFTGQAARFESSGSGGLSDFLLYIDEFFEREAREGEAQIVLEDTTTVKIMTIHASKGLQFPVVFLPYLNTKRTTQQGNVYFDSDLGLAHPVNLPAENQSGADHVLLNLIKDKQRQKDLAEARRIFYVAASRCSNQLYLSAALNNDKIEKDSAFSWLNDSFLSDGIDLPAEEQIEHDGFTLHIHRTFEDEQKTAPSHKKFEEGLTQLSQTVSRADVSGVTVPDYLQDIADTIGGRVFSATQVMTFVKNPRAYYQRYQLGFFEHDYESFANDVYQTDHSLLKGKIFHRFLERLEDAVSDPETLIERILTEFEVYDTGLYDQFKKELLNLHEQIGQSPQGKKVMQAAEAGNEITVTMRLGSDYLTGTLDRIYKNEQGLWEVIDYKTNRIAEDQVESESVKYEWQIKSYALLLSRLYPDQDHYPVALYFLVPDIIRRRSFLKAETGAIKAEFLDIIEKIKIQSG